MKNIFCIALCCLSGLTMLAQSSKGHIVFNRKTDYISIMSKLPHISQEDVDRMSLTWGSYESKGDNYDLYFDGQKSLYTRAERESDGGHSWKASKLILMRDYKSNTQEDLVETLGKVYHLKEDLSKTRWKILNEIKEVAGYVCMKAETKIADREQTVHAWFTDAIPFSGGPEGYGGLPGMILEININDSDAIITATKVDLEKADLKIPYPKKIKGKEIAKTDYDSLVNKYIEETIAGKKNPYWRVRY